MAVTGGNGPRALGRPRPLWSNAAVQTATGKRVLVVKPITVPSEEELIAARTTKAVVPNASGYECKRKGAYGKPGYDVAEQDIERQGNDD